jgi:hypothetical protein
MLLHHGNNGARVVMKDSISLIKEKNHQLVSLAKMAVPSVMLKVNLMDYVQDVSLDI